MATIDDKVVAMSFESSKFEQGVNAAINALEKLKSSLKFPDAGKGLDDINKSAKNVDLSHIANGVDSIKNKLGALSVAALAVFANIAQKAVSAGAQFVKSFTIQPLIAGFQEYSTNLNAIQTILANTQVSGANLQDVNKALNELNRYSDKTIYNFSQMAKNIGTFTAAGVDLDTSVGAIKGIANLAALSGSNADQASTAMYQLSQAIAAGSVKLQDWNSVVNAGMGGTTFQRALAQNAVAMGKLKDNAVKLTGPMKNVSINGEAFRQSLSTPGKASWLTSDVLTRTLEQFTGDLSDAQLAAQGFNAQQIKAIQQTAKTAMHAATEVKTFSQVLDVARETAGSGWAQTWQIIFGDFGEAKRTFTNLSNAINGFINANANARNKVLADWKALGGRTVLIQGIKQAFRDLAAVVKPIKDAFRDIFPATTGKDLFNLTVNFKNLMDRLKPSAQTIDNLRSTFRGLFALLDIGKQIVTGIFSVFGHLFNVVSSGQGGFLAITARIGDFLTALDKALKKGGQIQSFFDGLARALQGPLEILLNLQYAIGKLFSKFTPARFSKQINSVTHDLTPFQTVINAVSTAWDHLTKSVQSSGNILKPAFDAIIQLIQQLGPAIGHGISGMNFEAILQTIRTGLFAGLVLMFKNFFGKGSLLEQLSAGFGKGILGNISGSFKALEGSMVAMQQNIKAKTLKEIAIAVGILAASIVALSFVDPKRLNASLAAITVAFGQLLGAMAVLDKIGKSGGFIKMPIITGSMILLAGAIDTLAIAVIALSKLSWGEILKGLTSVGFLLAGLSAASVPLSANSSGMVRAGIGITAIAVGLKILASAMADFGQMNWGQITKGLASVAASLGIMALASRAMPTGMVAQGIGLIAIAAGLKILAGVVEKFGGMDWKTIGKGLIGIGGALLVIAGAMNLMPSNMPIIAAGLLLVSFALKGITNAVQSMAGMSLSQIAKGLGTLAGSLIILAAALYAMSGTTAGAAALGIAASGLALLAPALIALGKQSWGQILKGLITLGAALTVLGVAGALVGPVVPALLGLGAALLLIGAGLALAGAGIALIGVGLSAIAVAGPTAIGILLTALTDLTEAIPEFVKNMVLGLLEIVKMLAATAPQFVDALVKILNTLVDVIIQASPKIAQAFTALLNMALKVLHDNEGKIIQAGFDLLLALLKGIENNIGKLVTSVVNIVVKFIDAISNNLNRIIQAGDRLFASFIKGILMHVTDIITTVVNIIAKFTGAIASNLGKIVTAGLQVITKFLAAIAGQVGAVIKTATDVIVNFVNGVGNAGARIVTAGVNSIIKFINALSSQSVRLVDAGLKAVVNFLNGIANGIERYAPQIRAAGFRVGVAIVDGMTGGLLSKAGDLYSKVESVMNKAMGLLHKIPGVHSPSTVTTAIGENIILGLIQGIDNNATDVYKSATVVSKGVIDAFNETFQTASPSKVMYQIGQYVGQGFAQGLRGSSDDIKGAFQDMNNKFKDVIQSTKEDLGKNEDDLAALLKEKADKINAINDEKFKHEKDKIQKLAEVNKEYADRIKETQKTIDEDQTLLNRVIAGHTALTKTLQDEKKELIGLSDDYANISQKLKDAQQALTDAQKTRDDAVKSFTDQYTTLPDIVTKDAEGNAVDQLATYEAALNNQANAVAAYQSTLDQLRKLGLDDATYQKLLSEGTADQEFATQLLSGGRNAVQALNTLDANLQRVSKTLATNAATNLYQAGVDAAAGLVKGLKSKQNDLRDAMVDLANEIVATLKKQLKIKSPSEVFAEIGRYSVEGMAKGFSDSSKMVTDAVESAGNDAISAMKKSMSKISAAVSEGIDTNPVITPILDLTQVRAQSAELQTLTAPVSITAAASYSAASTISASQAVTPEDVVAAAPGGTSVKFEQNNYSPEALSEIEIYRQTKNQLSQFKSLLGVT